MGCSMHGGAKTYLFMYLKLFCFDFLFIRWLTEPSCIIVIVPTPMYGRVAGIAATRLVG